MFGFPGSPVGSFCPFLPVLHAKDSSAILPRIRKTSFILLYVDDLRFPPFPPLKELIDDFLELNGKIIVCTPCLSSHKFEKEELIEGVTTAGGATLIEAMKDAVVLSY